MDGWLEARSADHELPEAADGLAAWLVATGAERGDFVAVIGEASFFSVTCWLGAMRAGCVAVPLPPSVSPEAWRFIVATTGTRFACLQRASPAFTDPLPLGSHLLTEVPSAELRAISFSDAINRPRAELPEVPEDALAMVLFTSGAAGLPRGVKLTHKDLSAPCNVRAAWSFRSR